MENRKQCVDFLAKLRSRMTMTMSLIHRILCRVIIRYPENDVRWKVKYDLLV